VDSVSERGGHLGHIDDKVSDLTIEIVLVGEPIVATK